MHGNRRGNVSDRFGSPQLCWRVKHETWDPGVSRVKGRAVGGFRCGSAAWRAHVPSPTESSPTGAVLQAQGHFIISRHHDCRLSSLHREHACPALSLCLILSSPTTHTYTHTTHMHTHANIQHTHAHTHTAGGSSHALCTQETAARPHGNTCSRLLFL